MSPALGECSLTFLKNLSSANYFQSERKKSYYCFLMIYITKLKIQSKFRCDSDTHVFAPQKHVNKFHATKTKDLVGSYQTLLFSNQSKAKILWVYCTA